MEDNTKTLENNSENVISNNPINNSKVGISIEAKKRVKLSYAIRRKSLIAGLPGEDPDARKYFLSGSFDISTKGNLRGLRGELEKRIMPSIIGVSYNDVHFQQKIEEYWGNISVLIPADKEHLREENQGYVLNILLDMEQGVIDRVNLENSLEKKIEIINEAILKDKVRLYEESNADYLLLNFALKHSKVANKIEDVGKSMNIFFYIFNKKIAITHRFNLLEIKQKCYENFTKVSTNETLLNRLLVMFDKEPSSYDGVLDKALVLEEEFSKDVEKMRRFNNFIADKDLDIKYLILQATRLGKLIRPLNTTSYYYNDVILGTSLDEAVKFLKYNDNEKAKNIKETLEKELKINS